MKAVKGNRARGLQVLVGGGQIKHAVKQKQTEILRNM
jgi:hypothetical protein